VNRCAVENCGANRKRFQQYMLDSTVQFGLVAEDVEKVNPELVVRDNPGKPYAL
jgi:hypothetical protein